MIEMAKTKAEAKIKILIANTRTHTAYFSRFNWSILATNVGVDPSTSVA
jgi:hypothetical protein